MSIGRRPLRALWVMDHLGMPGGVFHGATRYFLYVLPKLDPALVELTLCFLGMHHPAEAALRERGIEPIFFSRARWDPRSIIDVWRLARQLQPDVMHLGGMKSMIVGRIVARAVGARAIIHLHDVKPNGHLVSFMHHRLAGWTDMALGVSEAAAQYAIDAYGIPAARAVALPNGVPLDRFADPGPIVRGQVRQALGIAPDARVIGVTGRLFAAKSQDLLIDAMPMIRERVPSAVLMLVGDGPQRQALAMLARQRGVADALVMTGQRDDVPRMLAAVDLVAVPTRMGEGIALSAIEALAAGKPVIGFRKGGLPELIKDGVNGVLVPPDDDAAFATLTAQLLADSDRIAAMGHAAPRSVQAYSVEQHVRRLHELYRTVVHHSLDAADESIATTAA